MCQWIFTGIKVSALALGAWSWGDRSFWGYGGYGNYGEDQVRSGRACKANAHHGANVLCSMCTDGPVNKTKFFPGLTPVEVQESL